MFDPQSWITPIFLFVLGLINGMYRSLVEDDADPLLLSLTFFSCTGTMFTLVSRVVENKPPSIFLVFSILLALLLIIFQVMVYKKQFRITEQHLRGVFRDAVIDKSNHVEVDNWTYIAKEITRVDFFPEFYKHVSGWFSGKGGPRRAKKEKLLDLIPTQIFDTSKLTVDKLEVPPKDRERWWRLYLGICIFSWIIYILSSIWK